MRREKKKRAAVETVHSLSRSFSLFLPPVTPNSRASLYCSPSIILSSGSRNDDCSGSGEPSRSERREKKEGEREGGQENNCIVVVVVREESRREAEGLRMSIGCSRSLAFPAPPPLSAPTFALRDSMVDSMLSRWAQRRRSDAARLGAARAELTEEGGEENFSVCFFCNLDRPMKRLPSQHPPRDSVPPLFSPNQSPGSTPTVNTHHLRRGAGHGQGRQEQQAPHFVVELRHG